MDEMVKAMVTILTAVIGVAIVATLVSKRSNTAGVLSAGGNAFSNILNSALAPIK